MAANFAKPAGAAPASGRDTNGVQASGGLTYRCRVHRGAVAYIFMQFIKITAAIESYIACTTGP
jgi:hypothetical protein